MQQDIDLNDLLTELKNTFVSEMPVRLDDMESLLLAMESSNNFQEKYENIYRHAHSLKGSAGSYGLHFITSICHAMEDALHDTKGSSERFLQYGVDYWLEYIDLIRQVLDDVNSGDNRSSEHEKKLASLQTKHISGGTYQTHCLVVTSSSVFENILSAVFADEAIKFSFCHDGYEALGRLLSERFDIIISDLEIPMLNGLALFGSLRLSDNKNKNIKTILLTSKQDGSYSRQTDPDYVILKDNNFSKNLSVALSSAIKAVHC